MMVPLVMLRSMSAMNRRCPMGRSNGKRENEMTALTGETCVACQGDAPTVSESQAAELNRQIPDWAIVSESDVARLERIFVFKDFRAALAFTVAVGDLAESQGHHPAILTEWGRVSVTWWTHKIGGLHRNDFVMAARTDELYSDG